MPVDDDGPVPEDAPLAAVRAASLERMRGEWIDFYDSDFHLVVRFVMRAAGTGAENARDAAQEAFVESWRLMTRDPDTWRKVDNPRAWIRTVALRYARRPPGPRKRPQITDHATMPDQVPDQIDPALEPAEWSAQTQLVLDALRSLDQRAQAVMAFRMDGFTFVQIAIELGITDQEARDTAKRARKILKGFLAAARTPGEGEPDER